MRAPSRRRRRNSARSDLGATLARFGDQLGQLTQSNERRLEAVRATVEQKLDALRADNTQKLEQMRATVDEKLQTTLEQRLGESFKLVSDRLEQVHKGLGEMQTLAVGVGDLKRVLTNVKTRGTWGEVQLGTLLAEVLTPQQYDANVETVPGSNRARRVRDPVARSRRRRRAVLAAGRRQIPARATGSGCRMRSSAPMRPRPTPRARRSPTSCGSRRRRSATPTSRRRTRPTSRSCSCRPKASTPR